ncbi:MAG: hypothetical protein KDA24_13855 [Deltaproteobacteria bacterium]|nr:hypothetical protein [Deltaproteobacteria bacterium]
MREPLPRERTWLVALLLVQALFFLALPMLGSAHAWTVLSSFSTEIAADMLGAGEHPLDGYDGLAAGPLVWATAQVPWLALLGRIGLVQVLGGLTLALGATFASWLCARELLGVRAAFVVAALVAFPPPNTWVHSHYGAYHVIPLLTAPLGFWMLLRGRSVGAWVAGVAVLGSSVAWSFGAIAVAAPLTIGWAWGRLRAGEGRRAAAAVLFGGAIATLPLLVKLGLHEHYGGMLPPDGDVARATKPFVLNIERTMAWPKELLHMIFVRFPYGLHFGLHRLPGAGPIYAAIVGAAWVIALRDRRLGAWLAVPPTVVAVGFFTGWFVFWPGDAVPFERDARHIVGLGHALALCVGGAFVAIRSRPSLAPVGDAAVAVLVLVGVASQVLAMQAAWAEGGRPDLRTPYRLESRYVSGFFRGPHFVTDPARGAASCEALDAPLEADCQRGVAMALGVNTAEPELLRSRCEALDAAAEPDLTSSCWVGRGWGVGMSNWRRPVRASAACGAIVGASAQEVTWCREGVGWGTAQDFADRPEAMRSWVTEMPVPERRAIATGVGLYAGMVAATEEYAARVCRRLVPEAQMARCLTGVSRNEGFMEPLR